jgi:phage shock protein C
MNTTSSPSSPTSRLTRSTSDKKLTGVAGGLAEYFRVDPLLVRVGFVVSLLFSGVGAIVYLTLLALLPTDVGGRAPLGPRPLAA